MLTKNELLDAISQCEREPLTSGKISKMADFITICNYLYGTPYESQYSERSQPLGKTIEVNGETDFLRTINGRDAEKVFKIIDEMAEVVRVLHPRVYDSVMDKLLDA